jgi:hypothetical protein
METTPAAGAAVDDGHAARHHYDDVALVRWPDDDRTRRARGDEGRATLLVVPAGARPPEAWGPLEDWLREPVDPVELYTRRERLRRRLDARTPAALDDDGLLHRGTRWVALSPMEVRLVRALLARQGSPVARADLVAAIRPETGVDDHRALDTFVRRARRRLAPLALAIHTVRGTGFMLEADELPAIGQ